MDNFDRLERKIYSSEVFDSAGEFKPEYSGYWSARLADHCLADAMRAHCAPALQARSVGEVDAAFASIPDFTGEMRLEKAASDWKKSVPVTVSATTLKAAYVGDWIVMDRADAYALGHDAYGRATSVTPRKKADNLSDVWEETSPVVVTSVGSVRDDGPDGPDDE